MRCALRLVAALSIVALVAACSSTGTLTVKQPKSASIPPGKTVVLAVTSPADEDSREAAQRMRSELFGRLVSEGVFKQVLAQDESADYAMDVRVGEVDEVSQGSRIFFGVFAGSNDVGASVAVRERPSDQVVTQFDVAGESASHPLSSEDDMDDAIREAVTRIIAALR